MNGVVVVGYGSDLRGDDAAGRRVAEAVDARGLPGVAVRSVHQLAPELADDLAWCRLAVFVDADVDAPEVRVRRLAPAAPDWNLTHHVDPSTLLALAAALGAPPADAVVVTVPVSEFGLGSPLSAATAAAVPEAVDRIVALCRDAGVSTGAPG